MKQKVSDYIADRLAQEGICQVFTVTGGGAMHLNDSLGHHPGLSCLYQHHEQAAAMAAEAYARVDNRMAAVCVTSGPGATNAITGALCAWMDSIPMIVLSGQVRYDTTVRHSGLKIRTMVRRTHDKICRHGDGSAYDPVSSGAGNLSGKNGSSGTVLAGSSAEYTECHHRNR